MSQVTKMNNWTARQKPTASGWTESTPVVQLNNFMDSSESKRTKRSKATPEPADSTPVIQLNNYMRDDENSRKQRVPISSTTPLRPFTEPVKWQNPTLNFPILHHLQRRSIIGNHRE